MKTLRAIILVAGVALFHSVAHAGGNFLGNFGNVMQGYDAAQQERERGRSSAPIGQWQGATNVGQEETGDPMLARCIYQTLGGYQFAINARGICPFHVEVNPETNQVRR